MPRKGESNKSGGDTSFVERIEMSNKQKIEITIKKKRLQNIDCCIISFERVDSQIGNEFEPQRITLFSSVMIKSH